MPLPLLTVCCVVGLGVVQPTFATPDRVKIEGRHHPELLPEYLVWRSGFRHLAVFSSPSDFAFVSEMGLSPADAQRVFDEARAQTDRDRDCEGKQDRVLMTTTNAAPADMLDAIQRVILECRWEVLHAQQRLLQDLSPDAQAAVVRWMHWYRMTITVHVLKHDLEFFRKPR